MEAINNGQFTNVKYLIQKSSLLSNWSNLVLLIVQMIQTSHIEQCNNVEQKQNGHNGHTKTNNIKSAIPMLPSKYVNLQLTLLRSVKSRTQLTSTYETIAISLQTIVNSLVWAYIVKWYLNIPVDEQINYGQQLIVKHK
jgi:hypothetical protein